MGSETLAAALVLFMAAAIPFARQLLSGAGILDDDIFLQSLPAWEWFARTLMSGDSPLWSPEMLGGFPIAFTQYPFLYPPDILLAWALPPIQAYAWSLVLHLLLAGLLTYGYCRIIGLSFGPALLAAVSFQMSTEVVAGSSGFAARSAFALPGILFAVELLLRRGWRYGPILSVIVAAALLGGHPQLVLLGFGAGAGYALFRLALVVRSAGVREAAVLCGVCALAAAVGVAGSAVRLLPTWDVVAMSTRAGGLPPEASGAALSPQGLLVGYLLPLSRLQTVPWGAPGYAGPATLVLAALAIRRLTAQPLGRFYLGLALLSAMLSMGEATPLYSLTRVPVLSLFREPSRFSLVTTFSISLLGGLALDELWRATRNTDRGPKSDRLKPLVLLVGLATAVAFAVGAVFQFGSGPMVEELRIWSQTHFVDALNPLRPRMTLAALGIPLTVLALQWRVAGRLSRRWSEGLLIATTIAVLVPVAAILNPAIDAGVLSRSPQTVRFLQGQGGLYRIYSQVPGMRLYNHIHYNGPSPEAGFADDLKYRFQAEMLAPVLNWRWGIDSIDGYEQLHSSYQEVMLRYLISERISRWVEVPDRWARLTMRERIRVLGMLNVRYILSAVDLTAEAPDLKRVASFQVDPGPNSRAAPSVFVLEIPNSLPRYYLVDDGRAFGSDVEALYQVAMGEINPSAVVLLQQDEAESSTAVHTGAQEGSDSRNRSVEVVSRRNTEVVLRVRTDHPTYLVTSDAYWPGWKASVDGQDVPVLRANVAGRAVWLEQAGEHSVTFRFDPPGFTAGLAISLGALVSCLGWIGLGIAAWRSRILVQSPKRQSVE